MRRGIDAKNFLIVRRSASGCCSSWSSSGI